MNTTGVHKKKHSKLEKILRQDHSDVYFDNERLNEELNRRISSMEKQMHQDDIQRGIEIGKLRKEIGELKAIRTKSAEQELKEISHRPHTAAGISRKQKSRDIQRAQSAWEHTGVRPTTVAEAENNTDDLNESLNTDNSTIQRVVSPVSEASTLRNPKTLKRYKVIDASCFKENNKFPEEWYIKCLPASDSAIYNARKKIRGKSAPSGFGLLGQLRERERSERNMMSFAKHKLTSNGREIMTDISGGDRMSLICEEPVKPILMSRRRLKELSNVDNVADRGPSRNTVRKQDLITQNESEVRHIHSKVQQFCKDLEELKTKEAVALKEREEAVIREAQERMYLKSIDIEQLENPESSQKENGDSDDERERTRWR